MKYLTDDEMGAMVNKAHKPYSVMLQLLRKTGIRVSEMLSLTPSSVDWDNKFLRVRCAKKRREEYRLLPVDDQLLLDLKQLCAKLKPDQRIFPWSAVWVWKVVKQVAKALNINPERAHPHAFRHGFGVHATKCLVPLPVIQQWLGHSKITTTQIYTQLAAPETVQYYKKMWGEG